MKKLKVVKGAKCMACLECVRACSTSFYKEFDPDRLLTKMVTQNLWFVFSVENVKKPVQRVQLHRMQKAFT